MYTIYKTAIYNILNYTLDFIKIEILNYIFLLNII